MISTKRVQLVPLGAVWTQFFFDGKWEDYSPGTFVAIFIVPENDLPYLAVEASDSAEILKQVLSGAKFKGYGLVAAPRTVSLMVHPDEFATASSE